MWVLYTGLYGGDKLDNIYSLEFLMCHAMKDHMVLLTLRDTSEFLIVCSNPIFYNRDDLLK